VRQSGESKSQQVNRALRTGSAAVVTEKKFGAAQNAAAKNPATTQVMSARKLEEEDEDFHLEAPTMEMRKLLQQERTKAGLTQQELAQMCNIKPAIIADYESGRGIPNP
jgi:putative transcription factor